MSEEKGNTSKMTEEVASRKRKLILPIWEFAFKLNPKEAMCNLCEAKLSCKDGNTTNMKNHILRNHASSDEAETLLERCKEINDLKSKREKEAMEKPKQRPITDFVLKKNLGKSKYEVTHEALAEFIVRANQPLSMCEDPSLRKLQFTLNNG